MEDADFLIRFKSENSAICKLLKPPLLMKNRIWFESIIENIQAIQTKLGVNYGVLILVCNDKLTALNLSGLAKSVIFTSNIKMVIGHTDQTGFNTYFISKDFHEI
jgi:hypothetical protein